MQSIEITGKSVAEAKKNAASKLGVSESELTVTVLEETVGLFGKSSVRIRAEVAASAPKTAVVEAPAAIAETPAAAEEPAKEPESKPEKPKRGSRAKAAPKVEAAAPVPEPEAPEEEPDEATAQGPSATEADANQLEQLVREMLDSASLDVAIKGASLSGRYVNIELDGRDVAHLVGKHGEVLNALQYLVNIIAGRRYNNGIRATLDGNNYRRRREEALHQLATRVAAEVKSRGEEAVLDALPAFERRIIHKSLSDYDGVQTYSEGEEPNRRVVIAPAD
ncbi:MAG TPA: RNA-binding cell elongation regulator Jag/EloR [Fimbriimonadaceae bacterium]|nr:RNA-binding cell elongation regulator Jag/EloR [Fimbriimonadaceae bacterium]